MHAKLVTALLTPILLLCDNPTTTFAEPILGHGIRDAIEREFSFVVSIALPNKFLYVDEKYFCAGTLISRWHVLTAAHCLSDKYLKKVQVTIGSVDLRLGRSFFSEKWITFDQWVGQHNITTKKVHDIAVIKLTEEVNTNTILPAKVWKKANQELYGKSAIVAGWGSTKDVKGTSRILQVANVTILSHMERSESVGSCSINPTKRRIHSKFLCSKAKPYVLLGAGDSGGPLIYGNDTIVGVLNGLCPPNAALDQKLSADTINKRRVNLFSSTASYQTFIHYCIENY